MKYSYFIHIHTPLHTYLENHHSQEIPSKGGEEKIKRGNHGKWKFWLPPSIKGCSANTTSWMVHFSRYQSAPVMGLHEHFPSGVQGVLPSPVPKEPAPRQRRTADFRVVMLMLVENHTRTAQDWDIFYGPSQRPCATQKGSRFVGCHVTSSCHFVAM